MWVNDYEGTRVFGTTLGHHNETVGHDAYLDLLTRGTLWAAGKLEADYLKKEEAKLVPLNLARGKAAKASSTQGGRPARDAFDGSGGTRWCADGAQVNEWLQVDLGKAEKIDAVRVNWESSEAVYKYTLEGSPPASPADSRRAILLQEFPPARFYEFHSPAPGSHTPSSPHPAQPFPAPQTTSPRRSVPARTPPPLAIQSTSRYLQPIAPTLRIPAHPRPARSIPAAPPAASDGSNSPVAGSSRPAQAHQTSAAAPAYNPSGATAAGIPRSRPHT